MGEKGGDRRPAGGRGVGKMKKPMHRLYGTTSFYRRGLRIPCRGCEDSVKSAVMRKISSGRLKSDRIRMDMTDVFWYNMTSIQRNVFFGVNMDDMLLPQSRQFDTDRPLAAIGTLDRRFSPFSDGGNGRSIVPSFCIGADRPRCTLTPKEYLATEEPPSLAQTTLETPFPFALVPLGQWSDLLDTLSSLYQSSSGHPPALTKQEAIPWNSAHTIH